MEGSSLKNITDSFTQVLKQIVPQFFNMVLLFFAEHYMSQREKPFCCDGCGNKISFSWKTKHGRQTALLTIFGKVKLNELQVQCQCCGRKMYMVRKLLKVAPRKRIPWATVCKLGLIGALTTFRTAQKIVGMFGWKLDKMSIWRSVQKLGKQINFNLDPAHKSHGEADGTGIPIRGIKKRGKELKVFIQLKKMGGVRIAGTSIGKYDGGWDKLFSPLIPVFERFKSFLLLTDGDSSILKPLGDKVNIIFQRCLWHIPHQFKYCLWQDKVKRKSKKWIKVLCLLIDICRISKLTDDDVDVQNMVDVKKKNLKELINYCKEQGWDKCTVYLQNAQDDMFRALENRLEGKTTSRVERVMRTVNMRINVGKWSPKGALNTIKIRLAHYYNDLNVEYEEKPLHS